MRRTLFIAGGTVAVLLVVAAVLLFWAAGTQQGLRFVWNQVTPRLPGEITAERVQGRLAGPVTIDGLIMRTEDYHVRIERADLQWRPSALFAGELDIEQLAVRGVEVTMLPRDAPAASAEPVEPDTWLADLDLPLDVHVRELDVNDLRLLTEPDADPIVVERARATGRLRDETLVLERLELEGPLFEVRGGLALAGAARVETDPLEADSTLQWRVRPEGYPEITGSTQLDGTLAAFTIEQETDAPYRSSLTLHVRDPLGDLSFAGELALETRTTELDPAQLDASVAMDASFEGTPQEVRVTGRAAVQAWDFDGEGLDAEWNALYTDGTVELQALELRHADWAARILAAGALTTDPEPAVDLRGTWSGLAYPFGEDAPMLRSDSGTFRIEGSLADYRVELDGALLLPDGTEGRLAARAAGGSQSLVLEHVELESAAGVIEGEGEAQWSPQLAGALRVSASDFDPGAIEPDWPGRLAAYANVEAALDEEDELAVRIEALEVDGLLRELPFELTAHGEYARETARIDALSLRSGDSELEVSGTAAERIDLQWRIESSNLADFGPDLRGSLHASGAVEGPYERPFVRAEASGRDLAAPGLIVGRLELDASLDTAGEAASTLALTVREAEIDQTTIDELLLEAQGTAERHALELSASTELGTADVRLTGTAERLWESDPVWRVELERANLDHEAIPAWQLARPAAGRLTAETVELAPACWVSGVAELCLEGDLTPEETTARLSLTDLPLDYLALLMTEPVPIQGSVSIHGWFEQTADAPPEGRIELTSSQGRLYPGDIEEQPDPLEFGPADGLVTLVDDRIESRLALPLEQDGHLELRLEIDAHPESEQPVLAFGPRPIDGSVVLEVPRLELVQPWFAELTDMDGSIEGRLDVAGTVDDPDAAGRLALSNGRARIRALNVTLEETEVVILADGTGELRLEGTARSGEGTGRVQGAVLLAAPGPIGRLEIRGEELLAMDTVDGQVFVSPNLVLTLEPERLQVTGSVNVPRGTLTPRDAGDFAVTVSEDEVIVDEETDQGTPWLPPFLAAVDVVLGEELFFEGYGLTGRLAGEITVEEEPDEPLQGFGELRVEEGTYEAYGQELEIRTGRLLFAGTITRPSLDIEAVRRPAEDILVGARVRGTPDRPEMTLFSEPPMPQQDQLSYLALGRPLQDATDTEALSMTNAALALGLRGGQYVSDRIEEGLGFEEFGIRTEPGEPLSQAAFVIGTYLSPSLYVSYGIGLFEPETTLRLHYRISRRLQLVTVSSSEGSGGDIFYHIERGD